MPEEYIEFKDQEFNKCNWLRRNQSPQYPLFNVNNHFYFRKLSSKISAKQSLTYGTKLMKCEEILLMVDRIWNSDDDAVSISRGWMSHHQVIAAALDMKGDNDYLRTKGGLDFEIKTTFIPNLEQNGVERIEINVQNETGEEYALPLRNKLKYDIPEMKNLKRVTLQMRKLFFSGIS